MGPYIRVVAACLLAGTLMDNGDTVDNAIAIVVELTQVKLAVELGERLADNLCDIVDGIVTLFIVEIDPSRDGGGHIELAI